MTSGITSYPNGPLDTRPKQQFDPRCAGEAVSRVPTIDVRLDDATRRIGEITETMAKMEAELRESATAVYGEEPPMPAKDGRPTNGEPRGALGTLDVAIGRQHEMLQRLMDAVQRLIGRRP